MFLTPGFHMKKNRVLNIITNIKHFSVKAYIGLNKLTNKFSLKLKIFGENTRKKTIEHIGKKIKTKNIIR